MDNVAIPQCDGTEADLSESQTGTVPTTGDCLSSSSDLRPASKKQRRKLAAVSPEISVSQVGCQQLANGLVSIAAAGLVGLAGLEPAAHCNAEPAAPYGGAGAAYGRANNIGRGGGARGAGAKKSGARESGGRHGTQGLSSARESGGRGPAKDTVAGGGGDGHNHDDEGGAGGGECEAGTRTGDDVGNVTARGRGRGRIRAAGQARAPRQTKAEKAAMTTAAAVMARGCRGREAEDSGGYMEQGLEGRGLLANVMDEEWGGDAPSPPLSPLPVPARSQRRRSERDSGSRQRAASPDADEAGGADGRAALGGKLDPALSGTRERAAVQRDSVAAEAVAWYRTLVPRRLLPVRAQSGGAAGTAVGGVLGEGDGGGGADEDCGVMALGSRSGLSVWVVGSLARADSDAKEGKAELAAVAALQAEMDGVERVSWVTWHMTRGRGYEVRQGRVWERDHVGARDSASKRGEGGKGAEGSERRLSVNARAREGLERRQETALAMRPRDSPSETNACAMRVRARGWVAAEARVSCFSQRTGVLALAFLVTKWSERDHHVTSNWYAGCLPWGGTRPPLSIGRRPASHRKPPSVGSRPGRLSIGSRQASHSLGRRAGLGRVAERPCSGADATLALA